MIGCSKSQFSEVGRADRLQSPEDNPTLSLQSLNEILGLSLEVPEPRAEVMETGGRVGLKLLPEPTGTLGDCSCPIFCEMKVDSYTPNLKIQEQKRSVKVEFLRTDPENVPLTS